TLVSQDEIPMGEILEVDEEAEAVIAELSQRQRHILCNYELSPAKLAEQLGVSTSTISNEKQALKKVLEPYGEGDGDNRVVVRAVELLDERAGQGGLV